MAFNISYIFTAIDKFSSVTIGIERSMTNLNTKITAINQKLAATAANLKHASAGMSLYFTAPLVALGVAGIHEFHELEQSMKQTELAYKLAGKRIGLTFKEIDEAVENLEQHSAFDKADIFKNVTSQLLAYKNLNGETFLKVQQTVIDFAAKANMSLSGSARALGMALENPTQGMLRLRRAGILLSDVEKASIITLQKSNHLHEAQALLLAIVQSKVKGAANAMADNAFTRFERGLRNFKEEIGKAILPTVSIFINLIASLFQKFNHLSDGTKKFIVIGIGLIAIIPPIIYLFGIWLAGINSMITMFGFLFTAVTRIVGAIDTLMIAIYMTNPELLAIKAIILLIVSALTYAYFSSEKFRNIINQLARDSIHLFKDAYLILKAFIGLLEKVPIIGKGLKNVFGDQTAATNEVLNRIAPHYDKTKYGKIAQWSGSFDSPEKKSLFNMLLKTTEPLAQNNANKTKADININLNDPGNFVKSVETKSDGRSFFNLGKNMAHI